MNKGTVAIVAFVIAALAGLFVAIGWTLGSISLVGVALVGIAAGLLASR